MLDGFLARRWGQITTIGTLLDPIADKLLISAALVSLVQVHAAPGWMAVVIIGREFAVSGLRGIAAAEGYTIRASELGKTKMISQVVAISFALAQRPPHEPDRRRALDDVGIGGVHARLRRRLFPEILAEGGCPHQEAAPERVTAPRAASETGRSAQSAGVGGFGSAI